MGVRAPFGYTIHHRKRIVDGGDDSERNKSIVLLTHHRAHNILFDGFSNEKKAFLLEIYWIKFGAGKAALMARDIVLNLIESQKKKKGQRIYNSKGLRQIRDLIHISKSEAKKICAWILLFDDLPLEMIVKNMNDVWLDPDFEFVVKTGTTRILVEKKKV